MTSGAPVGKPRGLTLEMVRWHLNREDQIRTTVWTRAGAVLSTNALVVAGTALAFSVEGTKHPSVAVLCTAFGALLAVAGSVIFASLALVTMRNWPVLPIDNDASILHAYPYVREHWTTFEDFRESVMNLSPEQQVRGALVELWKTTNLHRYQYFKLRVAMRCLISAIGFLQATVILAALAR